ncbi:MAG: hypothetical protein HQL57_05920 [Magnetococcales bacterium]|nr:hypothetical protein [Magnetococcales bacterium]
MVRNDGKASGERGAVLLILLTALVLAGVAVVLESLPLRSLKTREDRRASEAMSQAKDALLGYATLRDSNTLGYLPCPDLGTLQGYDGQGDSSACGALAGSYVIGFLPWRELGLSPLRDGSGAPLWYAVSRNFKRTENPTPASYPAIDAAAVGGLALAGEDFAAVIFAPGDPLSGQSRDPTQTAANLLGQFLEGSNANAPGSTGSFVKLAISDTFNDRLLGISPVEVRTAIARLSP